MADGRVISYRHHPGDGPAVLLVHGAGSSMASWDYVWDVLVDEGRNVLVVDLPGHGHSCTSPGTYHPDTSVDALVALLEHEQIERVHLVGHSLGGALVVGVADRIPDRVTSVTLVAAGGLGRSVSLPLRAATLPGAGLTLAAVFAPPTRRLLRQAAKVLTRWGLRAPIDAGTFSSIAWLGDRGRRDAFLATLGHVVGPAGQRLSTLPYLTRMDGRRFLLAWGLNDPILPVHHALRGHAALPGSRLRLFPGAGHEPHVDAPALFADALLGHIDHWDAS